MRAAARKVGVHHRAAYRHFVDKAAVLAAVALDGFEALVRRMRRELARAGPHAEMRLVALAQGYVAFAFARPAQFRIMFGPRLAEAGRFPELDAPIADAFGLVRDEIARGVAVGRLRNGAPRHAAIAIWSLTAHGLAGLVTRCGAFP